MVDKTGYINIPSTITDPNYRYRMPQMVLKIEGKGNGIKTNIVNMVDIAKSLRVPVQYPLKFMGYEFGSQTTCTQEGSTFITIINGANPEDDYRKALDRFIQQYILCSGCTYPEMVLKVVKSIVQGKCQSCGLVSSLDNTHKFATYIVKNPPADVGISEEIVDDKKKKEETKKKKKQEKVEEDKEDLQIKKPSKDDLKLEGVVMGQIIKRVTNIYNKNVNEEQEFDSKKVYQILKDQIKAFGIPQQLDDRFAFICFQGIFSHNIALEVKKNANLLIKLFKRFEVKHPLEQTLLNIQYFLLVTNKDIDFSKLIPTILKHFLDNEIFTEDFLKNWDDQKHELKTSFLFDVERNQTFKELSKPILNWLKQAEEDDEEQEEETTEVAPKSQEQDAPASTV